MPIYEYRCRQCDRVFEKLQRLSDPPLTACETCSGPLEKLISQTAFQFKGTGWYVTDYARKGKPGGASGKDKGDASESKGESSAETKSDGGSGSEASGKTESTSDSKSESKSDSKSESKTESKSEPAPAKPTTSSSSS